MKFELHCHSMYSKQGKIPWEGFGRPKEIIRTAKKIGLNGIALTDHSTIRGWSEAKKEAKKQEIIFIPGVEIKSKSGHLIALGISEYIKDNLSVEETVELIHEQGGLCVSPHPFDIRGDGIRNEIRKVDAVEVFNSLNLDGLSNRIANKKSDELKKPKVVGSDAHDLNMIGTSINFINAYDLDSLLKEIKKGNVQFKREYIPINIIIEWTKKRLIYSYKDVLNYIDLNYSFPKAWLAKNLLNRFINSESSFWEYFAKFGLNLSRIYSFFRIGYLYV